MTTNWQDKFSGYTTSVAFALQLSKPQVVALQLIDTLQWVGADTHMFFASASALIRRGLAEHNDIEGRREWVYRLTPAGKLVLDLVRMSGALDTPISRREAA